MRNLGIVARGRTARRALVAALMLTTAGGAGIAASSRALAQAAAQTVDFKVPAGPLSQALAVFGRQSGLQVTYLAASAAGKTSPGFTGRATRHEGLAGILAGSGLSYSFPNATTVAIGAAGSPSAPIAADGSTVLDTIDVTGGGSATASDLPFASPGSIAHISEAQIQRTPPTSVGDIFRNTPGVNAVGNRVGASMDLNIRGLQGQNRVNVMVDGTRQTNGSYRGYRGSRNEAYVDPDLLAGVDINKGPYSGAGGTGAMGGVVNMRTIDARDIVKEGQTYGARLRGSLGTNTQSPPSEGTEAIRNGPPGFNGDAWNGNIAAGLVEDNYEFVAALARRQQGNYFAGKNGAATFNTSRNGATKPYEKIFSPFGPGDEVLNTSQDTTTFLTKGKVKWGDGHSLELGYTYYNNQYGENDETLLGFATSPTFPLPATQKGLSETTTNTFRSTYQYDPADNDYVNVTANLWATDIDTFSQTLRSNTYGLGADGKTHVRTYGGDVSNRSTLETGFGLLTLNNGLEFVEERARESETRVYSPSAPDVPIYINSNPNGDRLLTSAFNQTRLDVTDWLRLEGGLRYDHYEAKGTSEGLSALPTGSDSRVNPSATVTVMPLDGLQLFASYTEGWRPPSLREWSVIGIGAIVQNPDLKPEVSKNIEFGFNVKRDGVFMAGDALRFKAVYFDNNYDDYIVRVRAPYSTYTWTNIDQAEFRGYELSARYDTGKVFVEAGFTKYDDIEFCGSNGVCGQAAAAGDYGVMNVPPKYSGTVTVGARLFDERLEIGTRVYSFGERLGGYGLVTGAVNPPTVWNKSTIVDLFGSYKLSKDVKIDFSAENLTDRYYMDAMSTGPIPSPGRTIRAGLTATF